LNPFKTLASAIDPLEAVGAILSKVFPSEEDRIQAQAVLEKIKNHPAALQVSLNEKESQHASLFVAGWRPFIGWVCGLGLANTFIINPLLQWFCGITGPQMPLDVMIELVIAMLGLGTLRTLEKFGGRAK
jgi:hypothetical protein